MTGTRFVGDLSRQDRQVLAEYAMRYPRVLEFGAGSSTQIFALRGHQNAAFYCVETEQRWIDSTMEHCRRLKARHPVYLSWREWQAFSPQEFDLIFNDGRDDLRMDFAINAWPMLGEGGVMIWHDALQQHVGKRIAALWERCYSEVESIDIGVAGSNMAVIKKRASLPHENWNENERLRNGHIATNPAHLGMTRDELLSLRQQMEAV